MIIRAIMRIECWTAEKEYLDFALFRAGAAGSMGPKTGWSKPWLCRISLLPYCSRLADIEEEEDKEALFLVNDLSDVK